LVGFFKRWLGKPAHRIWSESTLAQPDAPEPIVPSLTLIFLFDTLPKLSEATLYQGLSASGELQNPLRIFDEIVSADSGQYARLVFDEHQFRWLGVRAPAPSESVQQPIECSHWPLSDKEPLRQHQAHVICWYEGGGSDPGEQMMAMLRLASAFSKLGLLGVVDTDAWNCIPAAVLTKATQPDTLAACRTHVPVALWTGFVKLFKTEHDVWFCTKGFHRWGLCDFAFLGKHADAEQVAGLFGSLFHYLRQSNATLEPGHTAQFGKQFLRFGTVKEFAQYMESPLGTLVIEHQNCLQM
jgi:hypothetical protein